MRDRMAELVASVPAQERAVTAMAAAMRELRGHSGSEASATADILDAETALGTLQRLGWTLRPEHEPDAAALRRQIQRMAEASATDAVVTVRARGLVETPWWRPWERRRRLRLLARVVSWHADRDAAGYDL